MFLTSAVGVSPGWSSPSHSSISAATDVLPTCRKLSLEAVEQQLTMDCMRSSEKRVFSARFSQDCFCVGRRSVPSMVSKRVHHAAATRALSVKASVQCLSYIT